MSIISWTSPLPSSRILPVSSVTSSPSSALCVRNSSPKRRISSPRRGAGTVRQDWKAAAARPIIASRSRKDAVRTRPSFAPSIGECTARSPPVAASRSRPKASKSCAAVMSVTSPAGFAGAVAREPRRRRAALASLPSLHDTGLNDDLRNQLLLAVGHDMHARDALDLADLLDQLDAEPLALGLLVRRALQALDHRIGDVDAGDMRAHPIGRARGGERPDAGEDEAFLIEAKIAHPRHEALEERQVEAILGLDELGPGGDLLAHMNGAVVVRRNEGVGC